MGNSLESNAVVAGIWIAMIDNREQDRHGNSIGVCGASHTVGTLADVKMLAAHAER
jgi:hypothetical protein